MILDLRKQESKKIIEFQSDSSGSKNTGTIFETKQPSRTDHSLNSFRTLVLRK